jgi:hypothetical protein
LGLTIIGNLRDKGLILVSLSRMFNILSVGTITFSLSFKPLTISSPFLKLTILSKLSSTHLDLDFHEALSNLLPKQFAPYAFKYPILFSSHLYNLSVWLNNNNDLANSID